MDSCSFLLLNFPFNYEGDVVVTFPRLDRQFV